MKITDFIIVIIINMIISALSFPLQAEELKITESDERDTHCINAYKRFYADDVIRMSIYLGYLDFKSATHDQDFTNATIAALTTSCELARHPFACGFNYDAVEKGSLTKIITALDGQKKKVLIKTLSSSYSKWTYENEKESSGIVLQRALTQERWRDFEHSLQNDTVVIYIGHFRYGSGPDFGPLDPYSYKATKGSLLKPNLVRMKAALASASTPPKVLGIITCQAKSYYAKILNEVAPKTSLILTNQSTAFPDNLPTVLASLDSLLGMKCEEGFKKSFNDATNFYSTHKYDATTYKAKATSISDFFHKHNKYKDPSVISHYLFIDEYLVPSPGNDNLDEVISNEFPPLQQPHFLSMPYLRLN